MQQGKNYWTTNRLQFENRISDLQHKLDVKEREVLELQSEKLILEEKVQELESEKQLQAKPGGKTYTPTMRTMVYNAIACPVPTYNIPDLITKISWRSGVTLTEVPQRYACESMARELGVKLQMSEVILNNSNCVHKIRL